LYELYDNPIDETTSRKEYVWHYDINSLKIPTIKQSQVNYIIKETPTYKKGYVYNSNYETDVTIPDHANSVILELIRQDKTNTDLSIIIPNEELTTLQYNGNYKSDA
jgi:hypothetical protein